MMVRMPWLLFFVAVNIIAAAMMYSSGELIGDVAGIPLYSESALFWATTFIVLAHLLFLGPVFIGLSRVRVAPVRFGASDEVLGRRLGWFLIAAQALFLLFNALTGVNVAGANTTRVDNPLALIWVVLPVDTLFVVYYALYREHRLFAPNLAIWLVSNLLRGWAGAFLFVIFLEWCRAFRNGRVRKLRLAVIGMLILALYPLLTNLKWIVRASSATGLTPAGLVEAFTSNMDGIDYTEAIWLSVNHIIARVQQTSMLVEVMRLSHLLQDKFALGEFVPFWKEGLHGILADRLFAGHRPVYIGVAFTSYEDFGWEFTVGDWNVNLSWPSWFFIAPYLGGLYVVYTLFLGWASFFAMKKNGMTPLAKDLLWYAWLVYLLAPWLATFVTFIYALFLFLLLKRLAVGPKPLRRPKTLGAVAATRAGEDRTPARPSPATS